MGLEQELVGKSPVGQPNIIARAPRQAEERARHGKTRAETAEQYAVAQDLWDRLLTRHRGYLGEEYEEVRRHFEMTSREVERAAYAGTDRAQFPVRPEAAAVSPALLARGSPPRQRLGQMHRSETVVTTKGLSSLRALRCLCGTPEHFVEATDPGVGAGRGPLVL